MKIYLVTHAHTEQARDTAASSWLLSERGKAQAVALAREPFWNEVVQIIVSAEPKTRLTVEKTVNERGLPVREEHRLDELQRRGWIDDYASQVKRVFDAPNEEVSGWESIASVQQRSLAALHDLVEEYTPQTIAIVGHGICLSALRAAILGQVRVDFKTWQGLAFGSYACVEVHPMRKFNVMTLLQDFPVSDDLIR